MGSTSVALQFNDPEDQEHYRRLGQALFDSYDLHDVVRYIEEKTFLKGLKFSFLDHEFQKDILSDTQKVVYVQKCAQIGMTEAMARYALAISAIMPYFSVIMTLPFSSDASKFTKTRLNPIISESPELRDIVSSDLDNTEVKSIGNSLLYMRGCSGTTSALSVPADMLIHDEIDRSDPLVLGQYQSRLKHSKWKLTRMFGTPTAEGVGIAERMASARRMRHTCKCNHCSHVFVPSFHTDVVIPGYGGKKEDINKYNISDIRWQEAYLACPSCRAEPSLQMEHRAWVCENPDDKFEAIGYFVTPFSVPNVVSIPELVLEITKYDSWTEFCNQALGETSSSKNLQLTEADLKNTRYEGDLVSAEMHNMGIDVGQICHIAIGRLTDLGQLLVVYRERCVLAKLQERKEALALKYRVLITVIDMFPETHTVHQLQLRDRNLFGGVYHANAKLATYEICMVEKDLEEGKLPVNQAKIHRELNFDEILAMFKAGTILWQALDKQDDMLFISHCLDMRRQQVFNRSQELVYAWVKSSAGNDHYMHTLGYLHVACRLMPAVSRNVPFLNVPLMSTFRMKHA